jgi:hypothetical protein
MGLLDQLRQLFEAWRVAAAHIPTARAVERAIDLRDRGRPIDGLAEARAAFNLLVGQADSNEPSANYELLVTAACLVEELADAVGVQGLSSDELDRAVRYCETARTFSGQYAERLDWLRYRRIDGAPPR